jgi:hypothetical protein
MTFFFEITRQIAMAATPEKKYRMIWFALGFLSGWCFFMAYSALKLWPFEEDFIFHWMRWAGKETIKWGFVAVVFAVLLFVIVQLLNAILVYRNNDK